MSAKKPPALGNLENDFNFNQIPTPPFLLSTHPAPWSMPTAFRLEDAATLGQQRLGAQHGRLVATLTCTVRCRVSVSGYLQMHHDGQPHIGILSRVLTSRARERSPCSPAPSRARH